MITVLAIHTTAQPTDVLVVNKGRSNANLPGSVSFIELRSGKIVKTVPVGSEPRGKATINPEKQLTP